ncbi:angiopoietin-2-like [Drosophila busckii]|uniref:angiopoietin-2-like n=1 Tax=Drosophila busckii TaxID=30019 RepID=UPI001432BB57|nr:angiopoietin-2-like [Drosophila busckii]
MCAKQQILLLSLLCIALVAANSNASSNNMLQSKIIHIVDMQGMLDSIDFNASSKHIETISIANNYNETLLELQTAATKKLLAQLAAQLAQLALRLDNLNATLLSKNVAATSCSTLESVQLLVLPKIYPFRVLCAACKAGSGWIVLQQRFDGSLSYYRDWLAYRNGFGYYNSEFFLGLEYVYQLTNSRPYELYIELIDFDNRLYSARYGKLPCRQRSKSSTRSSPWARTAAVLAMRSATICTTSFPLMIGTTMLGLVAIALITMRVAGGSATIQTAISMADTSSVAPKRAKAFGGTHCTAISPCSPSACSSSPSTH